MGDFNPRTSEEWRILDDGCALRRFLDLFCICNRWTSLAVNTLTQNITLAIGGRLTKRIIKQVKWFIR